MKQILILVFACFVFNSFAQNDQRIGDWRSYLPYQEGLLVTQSAERVYYATSFSLLSVNKSDLSDIRFLSKVEGLSDIGIEQIHFDQDNDQLIVAYANSNIDVVTSEEIINLPNIKENNQLVGQKRIFDIHQADESTLYFAAAFGVLELNLKTLNFGATVRTNLPINSVTTEPNGKIYIGSEDGIYSFDQSTGQNILDFGLWQRLGQDQGFPFVYEADELEFANGKVYAKIDDDLYEQSGSGFSKVEIGDQSGFSIRYLSGTQNDLMVGLRDNSFNSKTLFIDTDDNMVEGGAGCINRTLYGIKDETGRVWYADQWAAFRYTETRTSGCNKLEFNSPRSEEILDLKVKDGVLYAASGGVDDKFIPVSNRDGFYIFEDGIWNNISDRNNDAIKDNDMANIIRVAPHPEKDQVFAGSYWEGLLQYEEGTGNSEHFGPDDSAIGPVVGDAQRARIAGLAFDGEGNLWMNSYGSVEPLVVYTKDSIWYSFDVDSGNDIANIVIDQNGYKWSIVAGAGGAVLVYDDNGTIEDPSDDQQFVFNSSNSEIEAGTVNSLAVDLDGDVWVGTANGPVSFQSSNAIFSGEERGDRQIVFQDSIPAELLKTENIRCMAIDGGNRKWFGTSNGLFVQSANGEEQELYFSEENSPLFDNQINALGYDGENGIMYISTNMGLQSYKTATTSATNIHSREVFAFPNPVPPNYEGVISIKGLARDANVKITDLNGKLVYETKALGGQATWNGRDYNGRKASTGVYFVFSTGRASFDTPDSFVTKIMFIN